MTWQFEILVRELFVQKTMCLVNMLTGNGLTCKKSLSLFYQGRL